MMQTHIGMKGFYSLTLRNAKTGEIRQEYEFLEISPFPNIILNSGLDRFAVGDFHQGVLLGSDSADPVETQTTMTGVMGVSTTYQSEGSGAQNLTTAPYYVSEYKTIRVAAGVATGNINQVAVGWGIDTSNNSYSGLFSIARIKDTNGNPLTITKLADEVLDVKYTLRLYCPSDATGVVTIGDQDYNYIARAASFGSWKTMWKNILNELYLSTFCTPNNIGTAFASPSDGDVTDPSSQTKGGYINGSYYIDLNIFADLNTVNFAGGIRSIMPMVLPSKNMQFQFNNVIDGSKIPKDATKRMTMVFRYSWGRAT